MFLVLQPFATLRAPSGFAQRLPGAPPGEEAAECAGGACASAPKQWIAEGCITVDDGTAECRLWSAGETLTKHVLQMAPSVLAEVQNEAMRLGPQSYSAAGELACDPGL